MIEHVVQQGSVEWHTLRSVIPTASNFDRLITPAKWEPTKGETRRGYQLDLLANRIFGLPDELAGVSALAHGREWEPIARAAYQFQHGVEIQDAGFFTDDAERYGASPDGLIGDDGLVEFKNPESPKVHLAALMDLIDYDSMPPDWTATAAKGISVNGFVRDHWAQVQGQLYVTGRAWCDLVCNFARLPMVVVRVYHNPVYIGILSGALDAFCADMSDLEAKAKANGWLKERPPLVMHGPMGELGITDADVERLLAARRAAQ
jgi:hypothetical protein